MQGFRSLAIVTFACALASHAAVATAQVAKQPTIVLAGGGALGPEIATPVLKMAGGANAIVAVIIHNKGAGDLVLDFWKQAKPLELISVDVKDLRFVREQLERATLIWFAGGEQTVLMDAIRDTPIPEIIRSQYAKGVIVGGTSAGAAILVKTMTTGDADLTSITTKRTKTAEGLGLWPAVLLEQHALKRQRLNRFISLVLDHPEHLGVAIDEGTAILIRGKRLQVIGVSSVVVVDARKADVPRTKEAPPAAARDVKMHVLTHDMQYDLGSAAPPPK